MRVHSGHLSESEIRPYGGDSYIGGWKGRNWPWWRFAPQHDFAVQTPLYAASKRHSRSASRALSQRNIYGTDGTTARNQAYTTSRLSMQAVLDSRSTCIVVSAWHSSPRALAS